MDGTSTANAPVVGAESAAQPTAPEPATYFGYAPEPTAGDAATGQQQPAEGQGEALPEGQQAEPTGTETPGEEGQTPDAKRTGDPATDAKQAQKDVGAAFKANAERLDQHYRAKAVDFINNDPIRRFGMMVLSNYDADSLENAIPEAMANLLGVHEAKGMSKADAQAMMEARLAKHGVKLTDIQPPHDPVREVEQKADALLQMESQGQLPEGFNLMTAAADKAFEALVNQFDPAAAVQIYHLQQTVKQLQTKADNAPRVIAEQIQQRAALPQSGRASASNGQPDYRNASAADIFAKAREMGANI